MMVGVVDQDDDDYGLPPTFPLPLDRINPY